MLRSFEEVEVTTSVSLTLPLRWRYMAILSMTFLTLLTACLPATPADPDTDTPPPVIDQGIASISFDDGTIGQYTHARPVPREANVPATYYLVSDALGWGSVTINPEQARELLNEGNEIGNHTKDHKDLADLTAAQVTAQFADSQDAIEEQVGAGPLPAPAFTAAATPPCGPRRKSTSEVADRPKGD